VFGGLCCGLGGLFYLLKVLFFLGDVKWDYVSRFRGCGDVLFGLIWLFGRWEELSVAIFGCCDVF